MSGPGQGGEQCLRKLSRETMRAKPVKGGTTKCPHCNEPRAPGHAYCREHRNQYQQQYRSKQKAKIAALVQHVGTWVEPA